MPHISLVFREMWDTTNLDVGLLGWESCRWSAVVFHISRKTSEIWGTRRLLKGQMSWTGGLVENYARQLIGLSLVQDADPGGEHHQGDP